MNRQEIKAKGLSMFKQQYWPVVGILVLATLIAAGAGSLNALPVVGIAVTVIVLPFVAIGTSWFCLGIYRGREAKVETLFEPFSNFGHVLGGYWYMYLFTFLWTLLFIIPGIIKGIAYSMAPYILIDQPDIPATEALEESMRMTDGHKWEIFVFYLSFLGWALLSAITLGIVGIFYVYPYMSVSLAGIYEELKAEQAAKLEQAQ